MRTTIAALIITALAATACNGDRAGDGVVERDTTFMTVPDTLMIERTITEDTIRDPDLRRDTLPRDTIR
jgi:hypothetical protein